MDNPKCFISYSQDNEEHNNWVLKLATDLRTHGVDVILDQWDLSLGKDLRFFMEQGLSEAAFVLCVCSENYVKKVNTGHGGAGYEGMVMTQSLLQNCNQDYVIPIVRNNQSDNKVPICFGSKRYIDFEDNSRYFDNYRTLLERIYNKDSSRKPPLGRNPFDTYISDEIALRTEVGKVNYSSPILDGHVKFLYENNNRMFDIGSGEYLFRTKWSGCGINAIYACGNVGVNNSYSDFPKVSDIVNFDFTSSTRTIRTGQIVIFANDRKHFAAIKMGKVTSTSHGDDIDEMEFDYHIYIVE